MLTEFDADAELVGSDELEIEVEGEVVDEDALDCDIVLLIDVEGLTVGEIDIEATVLALPEFEVDGVALDDLDVVQNCDDVHVMLEEQG